MKQPARPRPLLTAKSRLDRSLIQHKRFDDAIAKIVANLLFPTDTKIMWVIGPTGVGKSRLVEAIRNRLFSDHELLQLYKDDPGCIPAVSFEVPCISSNHQFAWRPFCHLYLDQLQAPIVPNERRLAALPPAEANRGPEHIVLNGIRHRRPLITMLDEANHFANAASSKALFEQMTRIKSFVNRSNVLHVLLGTYELAPLTMLSGQLARRGEVIHFGRYRSEDADDIRIFLGVVKNFQEAIPVAHHYDLVSHLQYLHERSLGCVGTLKTWLVRAMAHATMEGRSAIEHKDLEATALELERLRKMLEEALIGEARMAETTAPGEFLELLGHRTKTAQSTPERDLFGQVIDESPGRKKGKPFEPAPYRFPVGRDSAEVQQAG